jgi:ABC-type amino acid transport system permease subunit
MINWPSPNPIPEFRPTSPLSFCLLILYYFFLGGTMNLKLFFSAVVLMSLFHASFAADNLTRCATLQIQIDRIDAQARLAHSGQEGERLKEERRELRDKMVKLKCGK